MTLETMLRSMIREEVRAALAEAGSATEPIDGLLSVDGAAKRLAMSESYVRAKIRSGELPAERHGRAVRVRVADLDALGERRALDKPESAAARALEQLGVKRRK